MSTNGAQPTQGMLTFSPSWNAFSADRGFTLTHIPLLGKITGENSLLGVLATSHNFLLEHRLVAPVRGLILRLQHSRSSSQTGLFSHFLLIILFELNYSDYRGGVVRCLVPDKR